MARTFVLLTGSRQTGPDVSKLGYMESVELGVMDATERAGLNLFRIHPNQIRQEGAESIALDRPRGVLVTHWVGEVWRNNEFYEPFGRMGIPLVANGDGPHLAPFDRVVPDHDAGAYELTRWLVAHGRRHILRMWSADPESYWLAARDAGHARATREARLSTRPPVIMRDLHAVNGAASGDPEEATRAAARLIAGYLAEHLLGRDAKVDALMMTTDFEAHMAAEACRLLGKTPQRDVMIVGYDNMAFDPNVAIGEATGPVATADRNDVEMGRAMTTMLIDRIEGRLPPEPRRILVPPRILSCPDGGRATSRARAGRRR
jgi:DNA-binding LacI/PurR family transcriptional regulator